MAVEDTVKAVLNKVIDISVDDIKPDAGLEDEYDVDSTEMVEIAVSLKKQLNLDIGDNELKKTHSFNDIVNILKEKGVN